MIEDLRLSICICTRNRPEELARALESTRRSSVPVEEVVVADDSTDEVTTRLVRERFPWVAYVRGPRIGLGANRNAAVAAARGTHVLFIDDDVELDEDYVHLVRDRWRAAPAGDRARLILAGTELNHGLEVVPNEQGVLGFQSRPYRDGEQLRSVVINGAVFPRALFDEVRFDPALVYGYDEIDLTTRAVAAGFRIERVPGAHNHHRPSPAGRDYYRPHREASRLYVTRKRRVVTEGRSIAGHLLFGVAAAHAVAHAVRNGGAAGAGKGWGTVREASRLWRHRER